MNEQTGCQCQSSTQCLFQIVSANGMMLPWYMRSTLFQHATHLLPLYNVPQILHHDLEKCLKACVLLKNLRYTKSPSHKPYIQIFFKSIRIYRVLKKVKIQSYCKPFTKIYLTAFSSVVNIIAVPSALFSPTRAFKPFADCITYSFSLK